MAGFLAESIIEKIYQAAELYHRLILIAGPPGSGKTGVLREIHRRIGAPLFNLNLELSGRMLDLTERQRTLRVPNLLLEIVGKPDKDMVLLDNIELIFDVSLKQDPLRLLQGLSRNQTVVAAWGGAVSGDYLCYATADHPEYRRYPVQDLIVIEGSCE
jgi:hypothetical protein